VPPKNKFSSLSSILIAFVCKDTKKSVSLQHKTKNYKDMQSIRTLNDMIVFLQQRGDKKRVAVVCANDASTRYAVEKGKEMGFIEPIYRW
jgi:hypothetical protein